MDTNYMYANKYTEEFREFAATDYYSGRKLDVVSVIDGVFLPLKKIDPKGPLMGAGGVIDKEGNYVFESAQIGKGDTKDRFIGKYDYDVLTEQHENEVVIYLGAFPFHWGHFLVDFVPRLWYAAEHPSSYRLVYTSEKEDIKGVFLDFFKLLQIDEERLFRIEYPTRFAKILIPQTAYMACDYYTDEFRRIFEKIVRELYGLQLKPYEKIYMSRGHFADAHTKEVGEADIEHNFTINGFQVLYMEELTLQEQVFYISHCKVLAALSGTLCHNIVFANKDTKLIILNKTHIINTHQVLFNQMIGLTVDYVDVYRKPFKNFPVSYGAGPFWLDSSALERYFREHKYIYRNAKPYHKFVNFLIYAKMCMGVKLYSLYSDLYYKVCEYKFVIGVLRKIKQLASKDH